MSDVTLANPVNFNLVVDTFTVEEEGDGIEVGTDRTHVAKYRFNKPVSVELNGVVLSGSLTLYAEVTQPTKDIATAEGSNKNYDSLSRARQAAVARREALAKLRAAVVAGKDKVERVTV